MRRRMKNNSLIDDFNLNSLIDILTCEVGLMFFIVILAVMQARGVSIKTSLPKAIDPPEGSERKIFICKEGTLRPFDVAASVKKMELNDVYYQNVPMVVENANRKNIRDDYFNYKLDYDEWLESSNIYRRAISLVIDERMDKKGETTNQIKQPDSEIVQLIKQFDKDKVWISFAVDSESLEIFREARKICIEHGMLVGWDPMDIKFPHKEVMSGGDNSGNSGKMPIPFSKAQ